MKPESTLNSKFSILNSLVVVISALFISPVLRAAALPETAGLVPPETVLLVNIDNFSRLKTQLEKTNIYKLYKDPVLAAFITDAKTKWLEKIKKADKTIGSAIIDSDLLPEGRVAFVLVLNKKAEESKEPMALFITQWGENTSKVKKVVADAVKKAAEDGARQSSEDYRGLSIKTITAKESSRLAYGFSSTLSYCFVDDCLIGSEDIELLRYVIAHIKGAASPTLSADADYISTLAATGPHHDIDVYVNIKQIIQTVTAKDSTGKIQTTIANLGVDNVVALGCSVGIARNSGNSFYGKTLLKINGAKKGICKMLDIESAFLKAPRFIPASAYSAMFFNLNIKKAYDELANILNLFSPQAAAIMYTPLLPPGPDGQPGVQLKNDIIEHLGSQIIIAQSINKPFSGNSMPVEYHAALAITNRNALEKTFSLLYNKMIAPNNPDATRELLGHTIYLINLPNMLPFMPGGGMLPQPSAGSEAPGYPPRLSPPQAPVQMPKLAFTITDAHLIFGLESTVEQAIRTLSATAVESVGSAQWFTTAQSSIPSVVGSAGLQNNAASYEMLWWMLKESGKTQNQNPGVSAGISMGGNPGLIFSQMGLFDMTLLPEFDTVRKYFGLSATYGLSRPDGFFFEAKNIDAAGI